MKENLLKIVALTILEAEEFKPFGITIDSDGSTFLHEDFIRKITNLIVYRVREMHTDMLVNGWDDDTVDEKRLIANSSVRTALTSFGKKHQAKFRKLRFFDSCMRGDVRPPNNISITVALEINLLYPYYWFPLEFTVKF